MMQTGINSNVTHGMMTAEEWVEAEVAQEVMVAAMQEMEVLPVREGMVQIQVDAAEMLPAQLPEESEEAEVRQVAALVPPMEITVPTILKWAPVVVGQEEEAEAEMRPLPVEMEGMAEVT